MDAPEVVVGELLGAGHLEARDRAALRVEGLHHLLDRAVLAGARRCPGGRPGPPLRLGPQPVLQVAQPIELLRGPVAAGRLLVAEVAPGSSLARWTRSPGSTRSRERSISHRRIVARRVPCVDLERPTSKESIAMMLATASRPCPTASSRQRRAGCRTRPLGARIADRVTAVPRQLAVPRHPDDPRRDLDRAGTSSCSSTSTRTRSSSSTSRSPRQAAYAAPLILLAGNRAEMRDRMTLEHAAGAGRRRGTSRTSDLLTRQSARSSSGSRPSSTPSSRWSSRSRPPSSGCDGNGSTPARGERDTIVDTHSPRLCR